MHYHLERFIGRLIFVVVQPILYFVLLCLCLLRCSGKNGTNYFLFFSPFLYPLQVEDNVEYLCLACTKLYQALNERDMFGKRFKRRSVLLKTLYKLVDIDSDPLCLKLAKIILSVSVLKCCLIECEGSLKLRITTCI